MEVDMPHRSGLAYLTIPQTIATLKERKGKVVPAARLEELCVQGEIPGAQKAEHEWLIPVAWALDEFEIHNYPNAHDPKK
jgi:hypothetical protein